MNCVKHARGSCGGSRRARERGGASRSARRRLAFAVATLFVALLVLLYFPFLFLDRANIPSLGAVSGLGLASGIGANEGRGAGTPHHAAHLRSRSSTSGTAANDSGLAGGSGGSGGNGNDYHDNIYLASGSTPIPIHSHSRPSCSCPGSTVEQQRAAEARASTTAFLELRKPASNFHGNHWFHFGEYFARAHSAPQAHGLIPAHLSPPLENRGVGVGSGDTILLMAHKPGFAQQLTKFTMFLLLLCLSPDGSARRLEVFEPGWVYRSTDSSDITAPPWGSFESYGPTFVYDAAAAPSEVFRRVDLLQRIDGERECYCGKYNGGLGAKSTPSVDWFDNQQQVTSLREKAHRVCSSSGAHPGQGEAGGVGVDSSPFVKILQQGQDAPLPSGTSIQSGQEAPLVLTVYERDMDRHVVDLYGILQRLQQRIDAAWTVQLITHSEELEPCFLQRVMEGTSMFLTAHGFQSTAMLFLPPQAVIMEVFPYKYYKPSYVNLAKQLSLHHAFFQNESPTSTSREILRLVTQKWCMTSNKCRTHARGDSVVVESADFEKIVNTAKDVQMKRLPPISPLFH